MAKLKMANDMVMEFTIGDPEDPIFIKGTGLIINKVDKGQCIIKTIYFMMVTGNSAK